MRPVLIAVVVLAVAASTAQGDGVVLGSRQYAPAGSGFGTVKPHQIYNGGAPSGIAKDLHWKAWGASVARASGLTYLYKPGGGYYPKPGKIALKAHDLGTCAGDSTPTYRQLAFRIAKRPGEPVRGRWRPWSGSSDICAPRY